MVAFNNRIYVPWHVKSEAAAQSMWWLLKVCGGKDDNDAEDCTCWGLVTNLQLTGIPDIASAKF